MVMLETLYQKSPIMLQTMFLNAKALELYFERYGKKFWQLSKEFDRNQWLSQTELEVNQDDRLQLLIKHAYDTVPYYHDAMKVLKLAPSDFKTKADLPKLPTLKKDDVKKHASRMISTTYPKYLLRHGHTSGTTGSPLDFHYDITTCVVHHVVDWRQKQMGWVKLWSTVCVTPRASSCTDSTGASAVLEI